jgi:transposase InsO family protein
MDPRKRPHYRPRQRLASLWHAARYNLTVDAAARAFVVTRQTIVNWHRDVRQGITRLVQARSPLNRLPDLVEEITRRLKREWPRLGTRRIAGLLGRLGVAGSRSSVQRMLRGRRPWKKPTASAFMGAGTLVAKHPLHMVFIDFTRVQSLFRTLWIGAVIDGCSRKVLAIRSCAVPTAALACDLVLETIHRWGRPTWIISDRDPAFKSRRFTRLLRRRGVRRRFGAVGRKATPARIERFWRTLK